MRVRTDGTTRPVFLGELLHRSQEVPRQGPGHENGQQKGHAPYGREGPGLDPEELNIQGMRRRFVRAGSKPSDHMALSPDGHQLVAVGRSRLRAVDGLFFSVEEGYARGSGPRGSR